MNFLKLFRAELYKTKRMPFLAFYTALIAVSVGVFFLLFYIKPVEEFLKEGMGKEPNPWNAFYFRRYLFLFVIFLPLIASITTYVVKNIEDKSDAWKRVYVLPVSNVIIHLSKLSVIWLFITLYVGITILLLIAAGVSLDKLKPDFSFSEHPSLHKFLFVFLLKFEIAAIAITTLSYAYMILIKRTVVSLLLSIFLPFVGLFFISPYSSPLYQLHSFNISVSEMLINSYSYEMLHLQVITSHDFLCMGATVISFAIIVWASKRPIIYYE